MLQKENNRYIFASKKLTNTLKQTSEVIYSDLDSFHLNFQSQSSKKKLS